MGSYRFEIPELKESVVARILDAKGYHKKYINNFCEFKDPSITDSLFVYMGGVGLDWGMIQDMQVLSYKKGERWKVKTTSGYFDFQIVRNIKQKKIPSNGVKVGQSFDGDELSLKRMSKRSVTEILEEALERTYSIEFDLSPENFPWKID